MRRVREVATVVCKDNFAGYVNEIMPQCECASVSTTCISEIFRHCSELSLTVVFCHGINIFTYAPAQTSRPQARITSAQRHSACASRNCGRPAFRHVRFFRHARSCAGQIRDGATRACRWAARLEERSGLRIFKTVFLPGPGSARAWGTRGSGAQASGSTSLAQAQYGGRRLSTSRAFCERIVEFYGPITKSPGTFQSQSASAQHRARTHSTGKKTNVTVSLAVRDRAEAAYEQLRTSVCDSTSGGHFGLALLMREGMAAWMAHASSGATTSEVQPTKPVGVPLAIDPWSAEVVRVLASMALAQTQEIV